VNFPYFPPKEACQYGLDEIKRVDFSTFFNSGSYSTVLKSLIDYNAWSRQQQNGKKGDFKLHFARLLTMFKKVGRE
jgi:hypothetical protein